MPSLIWLRPLWVTKVWYVLVNLFRTSNHYRVLSDIVVNWFVVPLFYDLTIQFLDKVWIFVSHAVSDYNFVLMFAFFESIRCFWDLKPSIENIKKWWKTALSPRKSKLISRRSFITDCATAESCCSVRWFIVLVTNELGT